MNSLLNVIDDFFKENGILYNAFEHFQYRANQHKMALNVANILENGGVAIIEAGTGIGKTFSYLIPAILKNSKIVICTKSKNLQEQLFFKDLKILQQLFPSEIKSIYIKGRNNYICLDKLSKLSISNVFFKDTDITYINKWVKQTKLGDVSELKEYSTHPIIPYITSSSDSCKGSKCKFYNNCFIYKLKLEAEKSNIIIVNYHLLFADFKIKNQGFGRVLPEYQYLICDEAHSIEEIATEYFGDSISKYQFTNFIRELETNKYTNFQKFKNSFDEFFLILNDKIKKNSRDNLENIINNKILEKGDALILSLKELSKNLKISNNEDLEVLYEKAENFIQIIDKILFSKDNEYNVKWVEKTEKNISLKCYPIDVSHDLASFFYDLKGLVFTSATLSVNNNFNFFKNRIGLSLTDSENIYPSPFNYKEQALLYIPEKFPEPTSEKFVDNFFNQILELLKITKGNAFILFTNLKNMNIIADKLKSSVDYNILVQGDTSNIDMITKFKKKKNSVLLGSYSFWEGIDVPGENLSLVIIEKLPFSVPSDPLKKARINMIRDANGNPFFDYQVPEAIMVLKQGIGRLIRSNIDKGIIAIFDIRLFTKNYGKIFLKNLPPMKLIKHLNILKDNFLKLKNIS
jgi:ATP-dependent DNA helicase DinG